MVERIGGHEKKTTTKWRKGSAGKRVVSTLSGMVTRMPATSSSLSQACTPPLTHTHRD